MGPHLRTLVVQDHSRASYSVGLTYGLGSNYNTVPAKKRLRGESTRLQRLRYEFNPERAAMSFRHTSGKSMKLRKLCPRSRRLSKTEDVTPRSNDRRCDPSGTSPHLDVRYRRSMFALLILSAVLGSMPSEGATKVSGSISSGNWPLPGVIVKLDDQPEQITVTNAEGHFVFTVPKPGTYCLEAELPGFDPVSANINVPPEGSVVMSEMRVRRHPEMVVVSCVLPNFMMGRAFDEQGNPILGAHALLENGGSEALATSASGGVFGFQFPSSGGGPYSIVVSKEGLDPISISGVFPPHGFNIAVALCNRR